MKKILSLIFIIAFIFACNEAKDEISYKSFGPFKKGESPVSVIVKYTDGEISLSDTVDLLFEIEIEDGYDANSPNIDQEKIGNFIIKDIKYLESDVSAKGNKISRIQYKLEPLVSGKSKIGPFLIDFFKTKKENTKKDKVDNKKSVVNTDKETDKDIDKDNDKEFTIETDEIEIDIKGFENIDENNDKLYENENQENIKGESFLKTGIIILVIFVILLAIGYFLYYHFYLKKKKQNDKEEIIPAHIIAFKALEKLRDEKLIEDGKLKEFYYKISEIIRAYIENRFNIHAPDQTTEEFLEYTRKNKAFSDKQNQILHDFMQHCDMVKYAQHPPTNEEIQKSFIITKDFIDETKEVS